MTQRCPGDGCSGCDGCRRPSDVPEERRDDARAALVERRAERMFRDWVYGAMPVNPFPEWKDMPPFPKEGWLYAASQEIARERAAMERTRELAALEAIKWIGGDDGLASNIRDMDLPLPDATGEE